MTRKRYSRTLLVIRVRCWLLMAALSAVAIYVPEAIVALTVVPVGLMYAALATSPCSNCSPGTQGLTQMQADLAGVADANCTNCSVMNSTFILPYDPGTGVCVYRLSPANTTFCTPATQGVAIGFSWAGTPSGSAIEGSGGLTCDAGQYGYVSTLTPPVDCSDGSQLVSLAVSIGVSGTCCDYSLSTCTFTP